MVTKSFYESTADTNRWFNFNLCKETYFPTHYHASHELIFVRQGEIKVVVNGEERIMGEGEIVFLNPFDTHGYTCEEGSFTYGFVFDEVFQSLSLGEKYVLDSFLPVCEQTPAILKLLDLFYEKLNQKNDMIKSGFTSLIMGILFTNYPKSPAKNKKNANDFTNVLRYIDDNITQDFSLEEVAKEFGYAKNYFSTLFNKFTRMHFREWINRQRIKRIEEQKQNNPTQSIGQIAMFFGFNSLKTFYRVRKSLNEKS